MYFPDTDLPTLAGAFPPSVTEYLRECPVSETRDIIETLLYVYIAENSCYRNGRGQGVVEQSCFAYTSGPLFTLKQLDLVKEGKFYGMTVIRTTPAGERIAAPLMSSRLTGIDIGELAECTHTIVPVLLAGTVKGSYVNKTFPASLPKNERTFINFLLNNNPSLFRECEGFAARLKEAGCAALAYAYDLDGCRTEGTAYTFPPEFPYILKGVLERIDPDTRDQYEALLDDLYSRYTVLRYLATGEEADRVKASSTHRRELLRTLEILGDAVCILEHAPLNDEAGPVRCLIRDRSVYDSRIADLGRALMREVARVLDLERPAPIAAPAREPRFDPHPPLPAPEERVIPEKDDAIAYPLPEAATESGITPDDDLPESLPLPALEDAVRSEEAPAETKEDGDAEAAEEESPVPAPAPVPKETPQKRAKRSRKKEEEEAAPREEPLPVPAPGEDLDVFLGYTGEGEQVFWSPGKLNNGHMIILGGSGAGKTETIRCIAGELSARNLPVVLIDFHGDMASTTGPLRSYKIREGGSYYFNPLELDAEIDEISPLRATSDFVDAISINFPTLGIQQRRKIKTIIKDCYRMGGITGDTATWSRTLDFDDIEAEIMECEDEAIPAYLEDIFDYKLFSGDEKIAIPTILSGGVTHINLSALPESLRALFADLFLRRIYYTLQAMGEIPRGTESETEKFRLFVIVDEAKLLVSQKSGSKATVKAVLNKYATEMRKFGVSLILASQLIAHFNEEILANIAVKFCMRAENKKQAQENAKFFEVSEKDLLNFQPGEGILIIGSEKMNVRIVPTMGRNLQAVDNPYVEE